ncbi:MAG: 5-formyltetrahydrofolate cyclo-ligase [Hyphomonadaceae bacterium]|nr:5-formyltetrahydrofolate cyclo-ligase [Hyphomonadaceae bacterium]
MSDSSNQNSPEEIAERKAILRGHMKEIRTEAAARDPDAAERLAARFPMKLYDRYGPVVAGYLAIGEELDPAPLLARLARQGARIVLPRIESDGAMTFRDSNQATLEKGPFGLTQPSATAEIVRPNLVLTPLLAFDARGRRLGYGKGHYDRAIAALRSTGRVFYLGLAYAQQQVDVIPIDKHDLLLDWVETPLNSVPLFLGRAVAR